MEIVCIALGVYWLVLIVRILASWFPRPPHGPMATALRVVWSLTDPVLRPLRSIVPPLRIGMMGIDLSPIIVFVIIQVLRTALGCGAILR